MEIRFSREDLKNRRKEILTEIVGIKVEVNERLVEDTAYVFLGIMNGRGGR